VTEAPVAVNPEGPVQLYVVVPEAVVEADNVVEGLEQVSTPELLADADTEIPEETVHGPVSLNTSYCSM
jgi:hypothetical protein